ncbi:histone-lysine N-methyltransferase PRDM9-like [Littorina saxatilis]|uniref:histone-lysine N-methyltransferase PRDM9-like n=1 Tax=Littorina saxatilis TaxID=31220 RepID=UPI0038B605A5
MKKKEDYDKLNLPESIEEFFSKEQYETMCDLEKLRFKNMRLNYQMMLRYGLPAQKPDFMKPNWGISKRAVKSSDSESDDDWRPRAKRTKPQCPPFRPPKLAVQTPVPNGDPLLGNTQKDTASQEKKTKRQKHEKTKEEPHCYSLRTRKETNYMKLEVPNDDEFLYCEECNQEHEGDCPVHGPLLHVEDAQVPVKKRRDPNRALKTLPPGLEVKESGIPNAGLGVFATKFFPLRSRFGPYEGRSVSDPDIAHTSGYCWQICLDDRSSHFVDAKDCKTANWMRYVNCACSTPEQNVTAYQHCGEIYYRAHTLIPPGTEILVWYGREYAKELGIIREDEDKPKGIKTAHLISFEIELSLSGVYFIYDVLFIHICYFAAEPKQEQSAFDSLTFSDIATSDIGFTDSDDKKSSGKKRKKVKKTPALTKKEPPGHQATPSSSSDRQKAAASSSLLSQDRPNVCQRCNAAFVQFISLRIHMASAHGEKLLSVPRESCRPNGIVGNHGDRKGGHNKDTGRRHVCDVCNKAFTQAGSLKKHKMIHTGEKPFVCDVCRKAFTRAGNLETHKRIHTGEKPFVCDVCRKAFNQTSDLKKHKVIHTGEKPYKCPHCDAAFDQSSNLQSHIRSVHARDKPHVCDVCGAAFSVTFTLQRHKRIHTGEKPYVCSDCGKSFALSGTLIQHRRTHTGEKPYKCPHCPSAFTWSGHLKRHVQRLHQ